MRTAITGFESITCFGRAAETFQRLCFGECGVGKIRFSNPKQTNAHFAYQIKDGEDERPLRATGWLCDAVVEALRNAGHDPRTVRAAVVIGTGMRELRQVERWWVDGTPLDIDELDYVRAIRSVVPNATDVVTIANACAASGYALGVAQDMLTAGEADVVVAAGCDAPNESMLSMLGRVVTEPSDALRPFDADRLGVLLGDGAAAVVLETSENAEFRGVRPRAWLRGVGLSCDAFHETAPNPSGIALAMHDAHERAGITPQDIDLVIAHGTGTALNDPTEAAVLADVFGENGPFVTGLKGAIGHTAGASALNSVIAAIQSMDTGTVPPVTGLRTVLDGAETIKFVNTVRENVHPKVAQVDAFGFGGVNAVAVIEAVTS